MKPLEQYIDCMTRGDNLALAELFAENGILHDASFTKAGGNTLHLEGRKSIEMMFHNKFGTNGGPFPIQGLVCQGDSIARYLISFGDRVVPVIAILSPLDAQGKIQRLDILPL